MLQSLNPHPRDARIQFVEDTHTYFIDGSSDGITSTTTFIHSFFPHFNADMVLSKMKNKSQKYPGMSDAEIKEMWSKSGQEASKLGTKLHALIESFYNREFLSDDDQKTKEFSHFLSFHNEIIEKNGYLPYRTEWSIFDESIKLAGQADMLYKRPDGTLALFDWKRIKELKLDNPWEKGYGPCSKLDHCNRVHYFIQLNIYKRLLESLYDVKVTEMKLVILHPENDFYIIHPVPELSNLVDELFKTRL